MITVLTPHKDGWSLVLDAAQLESLKLDPTKPLEISSAGETIRMVPVSTTSGDQAFRQSLDDVNHTFGQVLQRLA